MATLSKSFIVKNGLAVTDGTTVTELFNNTGKFVVAPDADAAATSFFATPNGNVNLFAGTGSGDTITIGGASSTVSVGNLNVSGTVTTTNATTIQVDDPVITIGGDTAPSSDDNLDRGVEFRYHNGTVAKRGFFGFDDSTGKFTFIPDVTSGEGTQVFTGSLGTIDVAAVHINGTAIAASNLSNGVTGSGSVVLATSPSLTTPTLGVASATSINKVAITAPATSATLTIADGKTATFSNTLTFSGTDSATLNIGAGGTLAGMAYQAASSVAITGGTINGTTIGATTATTGRFTTVTSTQATGTAPFTVASTTAVTNLNADLLDGQHGSYYQDWTNITNKPDPIVTVTLTGDVTGTANATLTDLGNGTISVATTIAADSVALGTDTTGNYVAAVSGTANQISVSGSGTENATVTLSLPQDIATTSNVTFGGVTGTGNSVFGTTSTNTLTINSAVGIQGTPNSNYGLVLGKTSGTGIYNIYASGNAYNYFAGNVGIGATADPSVKLLVREPSTAATPAFLISLSTAAGGSLAWWVDDASQANPRWINQSGTSEPVEFRHGPSLTGLYLDGVGNASFGRAQTTNGALSVYNSSNSKISIETNDASGRGEISYASGEVYVKNYSVGDIQFFTNNVERFRTGSGGTVLTTVLKVVNTNGATFSATADTQDSISIVGRQGGTLSYRARLTPATLSATRDITIPDANGTVLVAQTSASSGYFDTSATTPSGTTRLNYGGYFYPTQINLTGTSDTTAQATHYFVETSSDGTVRPKALSDVRSEIVTTATLGSGMGNSSTYLRGDRTWSSVAAATLETARTLTIGSTGKSFNGSADVSWTLGEIGAAATNQTMYIGTTAVAINRASAALALTGITSIDGNAATVTNGVYTTGSYANPSWLTSLSETKVLPSQTSQSGKFLTTNGTSTSWATVDALPSQTGNSGKYLTTNGTTASWATVNAGATISSAAAATQYYLGLTSATSGAWTDARVDSSNLYYNTTDGTLYSTSFNSASDRNLKTEIHVIEDALNIVKQMHGVGFNWKHNYHKSYGVIAQDIEEIVPDIVTEDSNRKSVNYNAIIGFLIEAVKELSDKVDSLKV